MAGAGVSGFFPIDNGRDALLARLALADAAQHTLDVQYYIWSSDKTGRLLIERLLRAADRGVRVRLLLDDVGTALRDDALRALDAHRRIQVRLFNPIATRWARLLGAALNFPRASRRMHNKSFAADGRLAIVGGRNVGDAYFEASEVLEFADLDVLACGPVVREVGESFELFWKSAAAVRISRLRPWRVSREELLRRRAELAAHHGAMADSPYMRSLEESPLARQIHEGSVPFIHGRARTFYDLPGKIDALPAGTGSHLLPRLRPMLDGARSEVLIVSSYFVPGRAGMKALRELRERGVRVAVLTNSLASTDVAAVHAGYERYRAPLLRAGVELYESRPTAPLRRHVRAAAWRPRLASSRASLHAKTFVIDRRWIFIGSLNFDPRSIHLNTEIGIVFDSPPVAQRIAEGFTRDVPFSAWRLELREGRLVWLSDEGGVLLTKEPSSPWWRRALVRVLSWMPIEGQL